MIINEFCGILGIVKAKKTATIHKHPGYGIVLNSFSAWYLGVSR